MDRISEACVAFFKQDEWPYEALEQAPIVRSRYGGKNGYLDCWFQIRAPQDQIMFYARAPINAPEERRGAVAEFVTRANYGLFIGNFELDFSDGEVRYKVSADVEDTELNHTFMKNTAYTAVLTMDRYLPGLMKVIYSHTEPAEAIREVEDD